MPCDHRRWDPPTPTAGGYPSIRNVCQQSMPDERPFSSEWHALGSSRAAEHSERMRGPETRPRGHKRSAVLNSLGMEHELDLRFVIIGAVVLFGGFLAFAIFTIRWQYRRADQLLEKWAQEHGAKVLDKQKANPLGTGPMQRSGNKQVFYRVTMIDAAGASRVALFKLGSETSGTLSSDVSVNWE
jgi:hypothetical protein